MKGLARWSVSLVALLLLSAYPLSQVSANDTATPASKSTEQQHHRLVIQINKNDAEMQDHILSNIVNLQKHYGMDHIDIEVVAYGPGIWLLTDKSQHAARVKSLMLQNVVFTACSNTLDAIEAKDGKRPNLLPDVEQAQAGIARIMERQEQGWSYLSP
jgi:hypothetical protein